MVEIFIWHRSSSFCCELPPLLAWIRHVHCLQEQSASQPDRCARAGALHLSFPARADQLRTVDGQETPASKATFIARYVSDGHRSSPLSAAGECLPDTGTALCAITLCCRLELPKMRDG